MRCAHWSGRAAPHLRARCALRAGSALPLPCARFARDRWRFRQSAPRLRLTASLTKRGFCIIACRPSANRGKVWGGWAITSRPRYKTAVLYNRARGCASSKQGGGLSPRFGAKATPRRSRGSAPPGGLARVIGCRPCGLLCKRRKVAPRSRKESERTEALLP